MNSKSRSDYRSDSVPHAPSQASFKSRLMISFTHFPSNYRPINSHRGFSHCSILNLNFNSREPLLLEFSRTESCHISGKLEPSSSSLLLLKRWIFFLPRYFLRVENIELCQSPFSQISQISHPSSISQFPRRFNETKFSRARRGKGKLI